MKTSGIVALAIVVASMEVADAKCYVGYRSGMWQGTKDPKVLAGQVWIPTMNAKKIMVRGFRHNFQVGDNAVFYAGLKAEGLTAGLTELNTGNGGTAGVNLQYIYLPYTAGSGELLPVTTGDVTLDTNIAVSNGGAFVAGTSTVALLFWLAIANSNDGSPYAKFEFVPHFRGGSITGLRYQVSGQILVQGSRATAVTTPAATWYIGAGANTKNVRVFIGTMSWASSRDVLDALVTAADDTDAGVFHLAAGSVGGPLDLAGPIAPTSPATITAPGPINDVRDVKWMAYHDASAVPDGGIVGYVEA